jgi:hypothetical protein
VGAAKDEVEAALLGGLASSTFGRAGLEATAGLGTVGATALDAGADTSADLAVGLETVAAAARAAVLAVGAVKFDPDPDPLALACEVGLNGRLSGAETTRAAARRAATLGSLTSGGGLLLRIRAACGGAAADTERCVGFMTGSAVARVIGGSEGLLLRGCPVEHRRDGRRAVGGLCGLDNGLVCSRALCQTQTHLVFDVLYIVNGQVDGDAFYLVGGRRAESGFRRWSDWGDWLDCSCLTDDGPGSGFRGSIAETIAVRRNFASAVSRRSHTQIVILVGLVLVLRCEVQLGQGQRLLNHPFHDSPIRHLARFIRQKLIR